MSWARMSLRRSRPPDVNEALRGHCHVSGCPLLPLDAAGPPADAAPLLPGGPTLLLLQPGRWSQWLLEAGTSQKVRSWCDRARNLRGVRRPLVGKKGTMPGVDDRGILDRKLRHATFSAGSAAEPAALEDAREDHRKRAEKTYLPNKDTSATSRGGGVLEQVDSARVLANS